MDCTGNQGRRPQFPICSWQDGHSCTLLSARRRAGRPSFPAIRRPCSRCSISCTKPFSPRGVYAIRQSVKSTHGIVSASPRCAHALDHPHSPAASRWHTARSWRGSAATSVPAHRPVAAHRPDGCDYPSGNIPSKATRAARNARGAASNRGGDPGPNQRSAAGCFRAA